MATIKSIVAAGNDVHVVHWDQQGKLTPYQVSQLERVYFHPRSQANFVTLVELVNNINPDITVVSGWQDKLYLRIAKILRKQNHIVVVALDNHWDGSSKQQIARLLGLAGLFTTYFSHTWIPGCYQFEYVRKLGFKKENIIFDLYSADVPFFRKIYQEQIEIRKMKYPHRFLFVGRLEPVKGLSVLLEAWKTLGSERGDWELHVIGNGSLRDELTNTSGVVIKDFMQPDQLKQEIAQAGCLVLPSLKEPWGVVVHEFAAAGVPMILSDSVGSRSTFMIPGLNGFEFPTMNDRRLSSLLGKIVNLSHLELIEMSFFSSLLSTRITPETSAHNLLRLA